MRQPYWEWQDRKVKGRRTWLLPEKTRTNHYWLGAWRVESYSMSLLPTHQRVYEHRRIVCCQRRSDGESEDEEMRRNSTVRTTIATMNLFSTIWMRRVTLHRQFSSYQMTTEICEVVVQGSWDLSINIDVTCLHIATPAFCGDWDRRGKIIKYSTVNEGESKPHRKGGSRKCSVVATKILPPPQAINNYRFLVYKKPLLTYLCWIATSAVHRFEWNSSVVKAVLIVTDVHLNLSTLFAVSRFLSRVLRCSWMKIKPGFRDPEKMSLSPE